MAKDREVAPFAFNGVAGPRKRGNKLRRNALEPVLALVLACGGSSTPTGPTNYTLTVTATSGATQHTTQVAITVQ